jgi:hypothetical protein
MEVIFMKKALLVFTLILTFIFTNSLVFAAGKTTERKFTDTNKHWAEEAINKIVDKSQFPGKDGKFQPNKAITRSEFVLILHKALGIQIMYFKAPDITETFEDVKNEDVYTSALIDLVTTNIIDFKGHFKPNAALTREEMVHYIMNAYRYKMGESYKEIKMLFKPFADQNKINILYSGQIGRAEYMGLITRPASNMFHPKDKATRAQAALVIYRLVNQLEKENPQVLVTPSAEVKDGILKMKLTITNNNKSRIVINHTSGQKFDFKVLDAGRNIAYTWSADKMFIMALTETVIEPGKSVEFSAELDKAAFDSIKSKAVYMQAFIVGKSEGFTVNPNGYETTIQK